MGLLLKKQLNASFFGGIKFLWQGKVITQFSTKKVLGLFVYLLEKPQHEFSRDTLMTIFWGQFPESQARYNLRYALWNIRKLFKETELDIDPLGTSRTTCGMNSKFDFTTDIQEFQKLLGAKDNREKNLTTAIRLYKGHFLDGFVLRNLPEWEDWLYHQSEGLQRMFLNAAIELGGVYREQGKFNESLNLYSRALSYVHDFEPAHVGMIRAYADQGKVAFALHHYEKYAEIMRKEFKAPPHPDIAKLSEDLRSGSYETNDGGSPELKPIVIEEDEKTLEPSEIKPDEAPNILVQSPIYASDDGSPVLVQAQSSFIGREQEIADFQSIIKETVGGKGQVLIISGELGIGKTRLFRELVASVPKEFLIGVGAAEELHSTTPLEEFLHVLEFFRKDPKLPVDLRNKLNELLQNAHSHENEEENREQWYLQSIRSWIVELASRMPVLIFLDDMHWASFSALQVFSALAQDVKRLPIILVGIFRTFEMQSEENISSSLISIARTGRLWRMDLKQLNEADTLRLIADQTQEFSESIEGFDIKKIYKFCGGIPLFAVELAHFLEEGRMDVLESPLLDEKPDFTLDSRSVMVPSLMVKITNLRLSKLSKTYIDLLKKASLLVGNFSLELISSLMEIDEEKLEDMLVDLEQRNFLHHSEFGDKVYFYFNHQMVKLSIAQTITTFERRRFFKAIVNSITKLDEEVSTDRQAYYFYHSGSHAESIPFLLRSAESWLALGDRSNGLQYSKIAFRIAMDKLYTDPETMTRVVSSHANNLIGQGFVKEAIDAYNSVIEKLEQNIGSSEHGALLSKRDELKKLITNAPLTKTQVFSPLALVKAKRALANTKLIQNDVTGCEKLLDEAEGRLGQLDDTPEVIRESGMILQVRGKSLNNAEDYSSATRLLSNAMELLLLHGTDPEIAETWRLMGEIYIQLQSLDYAEEALKQSLILSEQEELIAERALVLQQYGHLALCQGNLVESEKYLRKAVATGKSVSELGDKYTYIQMDLIRVLMSQDKKDDAQIIAEEIEEELRVIPNNQIEEELRSLDW